MTVFSHLKIVIRRGGGRPLDINLSKDLSLLIHGFFWRIFKKPYSSLVLKSYKKSAKQENSSLFMNSVL
jgi:hypothetical protein